MIDNVSGVVAIELLAAAQGIDFHHPRQSSAVLEASHARVRECSPRFDTDRSLKPDVDAVADLIESGAFYAQCASILPSA